MSDAIVGLTLIHRIDACWRRVDDMATDGTPRKRTEPISRRTVIQVWFGAKRPIAWTTRGSARGEANAHRAAAKASMPVHMRRQSSRARAQLRTLKQITPAHPAGWPDARARCGAVDAAMWKSRNETSKPSGQSRITASPRPPWPAACSDALRTRTPYSSRSNSSSAERGRPE